MELLLLLWFYDDRWFFNLNISVTCYRNSWLIPLILNLFILGVSIYYLQVDATFKCHKTFQTWLISRAVFCFLIAINIIIFMWNISKIYNKEKKFLEKAKKIYPEIEEYHHLPTVQFDDLVRRKSLFTISGISLLVLGLVSLFWSYLIISFYKLNNYYVECDLKIKAFLEFHSFFIFIGNFPVIFLFVCMVLVKLASLISAYLCPSIFVKTYVPMRTNKEKECLKKNLR
jgi:hypothetical protein